MALVKINDFCGALSVSRGTIGSKISRGQIRCNSKKQIDTENPINYIYLLEVNGGNQEVFAEYDLRSKNRTNIQRKVNTNTENYKNILIRDKTVLKSAEKVQKAVFEKPSDGGGSVNIAPTVETKIIKEKKEVLVPAKMTSEERKQRLEENKQREIDREYNQTLLSIEIRKKKADLRLIERNAEIKEAQLEKIAGNTIPLDQVMSLMAINYKAIFKSFHSQLKNIASTTVQSLGGTNDDLHTVMKELEQVLNHIINKSKEKSQMDIDRLVEEYSEVRSRGERK